MIDVCAITDHWRDLLDGFRLTLWLSAVAWILSVAIGAGLTTLRLAGWRPARLLVRGFIDFMRGMPSLLLILACFYLLPATGLRLNSVQSGLSALALYYGAYMSEAMRGALATIPSGQIEAATATGLPPARTLRRIVLPQAIGPMIPAVAGLTIGLFKETALLSAISVHELVFAGKEAISDSYAPFQIYAAIALLYWAASGVIAAIAGWIETRATSYRSDAPPAVRA